MRPKRIAAILFAAINWAVAMSPGVAQAQDTRSWAPGNGAPPSFMTEIDDGRVSALGFLVIADQSGLFGRARLTFNSVHWTDDGQRYYFMYTHGPNAGCQIYVSPGAEPPGFTQSAANATVLVNPSLYGSSQTPGATIGATEFEEINGIMWARWREIQGSRISRNAWAMYVRPSRAIIVARSCWSNTEAEAGLLLNLLVVHIA